MRRLPLHERISRALAFLFFGCFLAGLVWVQVTQRIFRWQAERLMHDLRQLQPGQAGWADFQRLQARWGGHAAYEGECVPSHCDYAVSLRVPLGLDWLPYQQISPWQERLQLRLYNIVVPALLVVHAHLPSVLAQITVRNGKVRTQRLRFCLGVPEGAGPGWRDQENASKKNYVPYSSGTYGLIAGYALQAAHLDRDGRMPVVNWPEQDQHPESMIWRPGGCENCIESVGVVTPYTPAAERAELTTINLDCLTRWRPCVDERDMMPGVYRRLLEDDALRARQAPRLAACDFPQSQRYSAAANVAVVKVLRQQDEPQSFGPEIIVKPLQHLKGDSPISLDREYQLDEADGAMSRHPLDFSTGNRLLIMFDGISSYPGRLELIEAYQCGVTLAPTR